MNSFNLRGVLLTCLLGFFSFFFLSAQDNQDPPCGCTSGSIVESGEQLLFEAEVELEFEPDSANGNFWNRFEENLDIYYAWVDTFASDTMLEQPEDIATYGNICYSIQINTPGFYRFQMRSTIDSSAFDNSVWVRFRGDHQTYRGVDDNPDTQIEAFLDSNAGWFVAYRTVAGTNWLWLTRTGSSEIDEGNPYGGVQMQTFHRNIYVEFKSAGYYAMELSAREEGFGIDKFFLYKVNTEVLAGGEIRVMDEFLEDSVINDLDLSSIEAPVAVEISPTNEDTILCPNEAFSLVATASGGTQGYTYQWKSDLADSLGLEFVYGEDSLVQKTVFTAIITDLYGCKDTASLTLTPNPDLTVNAGEDIVFCEGGSKSQSLGGMPVAMGGTGSFKYNWKPDGFFDDGSNNFDQNPSIKNPGIQTEFTLTVTDEQGCGAMDTVTVIVNPTPSINTTNLQSRYFSFNNENLTIPLSGSPEEAIFRWEIIDADNLLTNLEPDSGSQITQSFQLQDSTMEGMATYRIFPFLNGCEGEPFDIEIEIWLRPNAPAVLTPNGDGMNDEWKPNAPEEGFSVSVFSRRGAVVFQSDNPDMPWDGGNSPDGIYWYVMKTLLGEFKGALLLQRSIRR